MVALTPTTHLLLQLSDSLIKAALPGSIFALEEKGIPHKHTQI